MLTSIICSIWKGQVNPIAKAVWAAVLSLFGRSFGACWCFSTWPSREVFSETAGLLDCFFGKIEHAPHFLPFQLDKVLPPNFKDKIPTIAISGTDLLKVPTIWPKIWYSTSILGSWNSHWSETVAVDSMGHWMSWRENLNRKPCFLPLFTMKSRIITTHGQHHICREDHVIVKLVTGSTVGSGLIFLSSQGNYWWLVGGFKHDFYFLYPLVNIQKAIENGHRNSGFTH